MAGDEVDAGVRPAAVGLVEVAGAGEPVGDVGHPGAGAAPEVAHGVAVAAVPLGPQDREVADLVAALADVPRLGDQLDPAHHRVLVDQVEEGRQPVDLVEAAGQGRGQVEAEAVDVHLLDPVAQRVHDQGQHLGMAGVEGVAGAGVVHVEAPVGVHRPVVGVVVEAPERQRRAHVVALGGVVVDDVQDHLDPGRVEVADHRLELAHLLAPGPGGGVAGLGGEEADRVVAPVVGQPHLDQVVLGHELVDRQQLQGGHAEALEVGHHRVRAHGREAAPLVRRHVRVPHGEPAHVGLVDDRVRPGHVRAAVLAPREGVVDHHRPGHVRARVAVVGVQVVAADPVAEHRLVPVDHPLDGPRVGVEQELGRVAARPPLRVVGAVDPEAVALAGADLGHVAVPGVGGDLGQAQPPLDPGLVEQGQVDGVGPLGEDGEVGALAVPGRPQRPGLPWPHGLWSGRHRLVGNDMVGVSVP